MKSIFVIALTVALSNRLSAQNSNQPVTSASSGASIFQERCSRCHGPDGSSDTFIGHRWNIPDLRSKAVQGLSIDERIKIITEGKNKMPAHGKRLTAEEIKQVESYVRELGGKVAEANHSDNGKAR